MICEHCRLVIYSGHHSPQWCAGFSEPARPAVVLPPKPQPVRGQLGVCTVKGCYGPTVPGKALCSPCTRALAEQGPS